MERPTFAKTKKIIAVLGATGLQGGSVVHAFLNDVHQRFTVRAITRNTGSASSSALRLAGAEVVYGDFNSKQSLEEAFGGAHFVFAVTDFWAQGLLDVEVLHGRSIADAAAAAKSIEHFVFSSLPDPIKASHGKYKNILHYNSKNEIVEYIKEHQLGLAQKMTEVWVASYFENWKEYSGSGVLGPMKLSDGKYEMAVPGKPSRANPSVLCDDLGKMVLEVFTMGAPYMGKKISFYSETLADIDRLRVWAQAAKVDASFRQTTIEEYQPRMTKSFAPHLVLDMTERMLWDESAFPENDGELLDGKKILTEKGVLLKSWADYVAEEDWACH